MRPSAVGGDPHWASVVALLHLDGVNGSTTFTDQKGHTFSNGAGAALSTAQQKFGGASLLLNGAGQFISSPSTTDFDLGGGDFTVECWLRPAIVVSTRMEIIERWSNQGISVQIMDTGFLRALATNNESGTVFAGPGATTVTHNTWHHIAFVRDGSTLRLFLNGVSQGTSSFTGSILGINEPLNIGYDNGVGRHFNGNIDEIRITKGVARYTSNFTPPTAAFPNG